MDTLTGFLDKFTHLLDKRNKEKEVIVGHIADVAFVTLAPEDVSIKNNTLYIKAPASVRSSIFMKKEKIISLCKKSFRDNRITDVR